MDRRWLVAWIVALLLAAAGVVVFERFLRANHYFPTVQDDKDLWSLQVDRLRRDGNTIVLLGASRIQYAVDPVIVGRYAGRPSVMLAINGAYPVASLRYLAQDPQFHGLAIVGIDSRGLSKRHWEMQQPWIDHYEHRWTLAREIHRRLLTPLQQHLVFVRSPFAMVQMVRRQLANYGLPINDYVVLRPDRMGELDYRRTNVDAIRDRRVLDLREYYRDNPPEPATQWLGELSEVSAWVRAIQARGGQVVFFREPSAGEHLVLDETNYPRDAYWDAYARVSPAVMIDFRDVPAFAALRLPDTSHIDGSDVPRFTRILLEALTRKGILRMVTNMHDAGNLDVGK